MLDSIPPSEDFLWSTMMLFIGFLFNLLAFASVLLVSYLLLMYMHDEKAKKRESNEAEEREEDVVDDKGYEASGEEMSKSFDDEEEVCSLDDSKLVVGEEREERVKDEDTEVDEILKKVSELDEQTNDPVFVAPPPPNHSPNMNKPYPLLCHLNKHSSSDEFGFNLHAEKNHGHFIGTVDEGGIGSSAGLKMGQRIVGVNNTLIYPTTPHKDVVGYIKSNPMETSLLVVSEDTDAWYKSHNEPFSFSYSKPGVEPQPQQLSPHSIQISDEEVEQVSPVPKLEEHVPVQYDVPPSHINAQYDLPPPTRYDTVPDEVINSDDLMAAVFGNTPITTDVVVTSPDLSREERAATQPHLETHGGHSRAPSVDPSEVSFHHESAVDVPHNYNAYADSHVYDKHREYSAYSHDEPKSNGFSHHSVSPSVDESDIFNLSASEARKRLQHKKDRRGLDMTLDEKYHLVSNM